MKERLDLDAKINERRFKAEGGHRIAKAEIRVWGLSGACRVAESDGRVGQRVSDFSVHC